MPKTILDFDVLDVLDTKTLTIIDKSEYLCNDPEKPVMEVLIPGNTKPILVPFRPNTINVINAHQLNLSCGDNSNMPDGVYRLTYRICPQDSMYIDKYYLKTDILEYQLDILLLKVLSCKDINKDLKKTFDSIFLYLTAAKAHARAENIKEATSLYKRAQKEINKTNCK
jgi:hypothetical protein